MINIYKQILANSFQDENVKAELTSDLAVIGRINGFSPILAMTESEANALEYRFIGEYDKVLGPIYENFDKALNLEICPIGVSEFAPIIYQIRKDKRIKAFFLALIGKTSFYDVTPIATLRLPGVQHLMSRYSRLSDIAHSNCCILL